MANQEVAHDFTQLLSSESTGLTFESELFAFDWAQTRSNECQFNIIRSSRRKRADGTYHHYFTCECAMRCESVKVKSKKNRKRKSIFSTLAEKGQRITASKRVGCKFRGAIRKEFDGMYHIEVFQGCHNHPLTYYIQGNLAYTRLTSDDKVKIKEMFFAHCAPKAIVKALKYSDDLKPVLKRAVYNYTSKLKKEAAEGRNPAMHFLQLARDRDYFTRHVVEPRTQHKLKDLFWSHPNARQMLRVYPTVFCIDSTYSTNKYNYALVEIIGVTPTNQNFTAAQALLQHEDKDSYMWAMTCFAELLGDIRPEAMVTDRELGLMEPIANVFPHSHHLLCMHHVKKMIRAKAATALRSGKDADRLCNGAVRVMLEAPTLEQYVENEAKLRLKYGWVPGFISYLEETWLPHKEKIVLAWTNNVKHFGNNTTNRVEGAHSALKGWMSSCRGGLDTLFDKTHAEVEGQISEIKCMLEWSQAKNLIGFGVSPFSPLLRQVSHYCLIVLRNECIKMGKCTHALPTTHGLPCRCQIEYLRLHGEFIHPERLDPFWRTLAYDGEAVEAPYCPYDVAKMIQEVESRDPADQRRLWELFHAEMYPEEGIFEEPEVNVTKKGRPAKKKSKITRLLSGWEHVNKQFGSSRASDQAISRRSDEELDRAGGTSVPLFVREYLVSIDDVEGDGNCGFRCAALRFLKSPHLFVTVRQLLIAEITANQKVYKKVYLRGDGGIAAAVKRLDWKGKRCTTSHWMETPSDLFAVAQAFRAVATVYSYHGNGSHACCTVLPWRGDIEDYEELPEISFIHVRGRLHYVLGHFTDDEDSMADNPLPKIHSLWYTLRNRSLRPWEDLYADRLQRFQDLQGMFNNHVESQVPADKRNSNHIDLSHL